mmetsp:Transcript_768/g.1760  ORF Transcript_768/g.1760 Transcript_768/m.1760 type:complete len:218 (-) Transcript_768:849-1502(-)
MPDGVADPRHCGQFGVLACTSGVVPLASDLGKACGGHRGRQCVRHKRVHRRRHVVRRAHALCGQNAGVQCRGACVGAGIQPCHLPPEHQPWVHPHRRAHRSRLVHRHPAGHLLCRLPPVFRGPRAPRGPLKRVHHGRDICSGVAARAGERVRVPAPADGGGAGSAGPVRTLAKTQGRGHPPAQARVAGRALLGALPAEPPRRVFCGAICPELQFFCA